MFQSTLNTKENTMKIRFFTFPLFLAFFIALTATRLSAQDPQLSLWQYAPHYSNPAMVGVYDGQFRASFNYRNQWFAFLGNNSFTTMHGSFDTRIQAFGQDYLALGVNALSDKAGQSQFSQNMGNVSASYMKMLSSSNHYSNRVQYLILGGQFGIAQNSMNWNDLTFSAQFDGEAYNPNLGTGETFGNESFTYMNMGAGLMWYGVFDERMSLWFGAAGQHLNQPNVSFYDGTTDALHTKLSANVGGEVAVGPSISLLPSLLFMSQGPSWQILPGVGIRYTKDEWQEVALRAGVAQRIVGKYDDSMDVDATTVMAGIEFQSLTFALNYDLNISSLQPATNRRGAFELAIIYKHPPASLRESVKCPSF